jgi:outer membrane receptor for monomeric catechols
MNDVSPGFGSNSFVDFSVNGVRTDENNLLIDGVRNVDTFGGNAFVAPNLFAISEVRIENNDYTATAGRSAGGQVNLISRSGSSMTAGDPTASSALSAPPSTTPSTSPTLRLITPVEHPVRSMPPL